MDKKRVVNNKKQQPFYTKKWVIGVGILFAIVAVILLAFRVSPWPGALIIRADFEQNGKKTTQAMQRHAPTSGIATIANQQYINGDPDATLDVYMPTMAQQSNQKLPVLIWTHGGAWLSGDKSDVAPYLQLLSQKGYVTIGVNYSLAPGKTYPTQINQLNDAHAYIAANAERFHADMDKVMLAGDSAGSQLSAQLAALITNPIYASEVGFTPKLQPAQLKGVILNCGIYRMEELAYPNPSLSKLIGWGDDVTVWAYSGTHDFANPVIREMSPYYHVSKDFPPTYISGGNGDPLTDKQSKPLADKLLSLGVKVTSLFYEQNHTPSLPHEYQFNLDNQDGQNALQRTVQFMQQQTTK